MIKANSFQLQEQTWVQEKPPGQSCIEGHPNQSAIFVSSLDKLPFSEQKSPFSEQILLILSVNYLEISDSISRIIRHLLGITPMILLRNMVLTFLRYRTYRIYMNV